LKGLIRVKQTAQVKLIVDDTLRSQGESDSATAPTCARTDR
jgi:hypothetical protein